jgi:hypothetical protein
MVDVSTFKDGVIGMVIKKDGEQEMASILETRSQDKWIREVDILLMSGTKLTIVISTYELDQIMHAVKAKESK